MVEQVTAVQELKTLLQQVLPQAVAVVVEQPVAMDQEMEMDLQATLVDLVERGLLTLDRLVTVVLAMVVVVVLCQIVFILL